MCTSYVNIKAEKSPQNFQNQILGRQHGIKYRTLFDQVVIVFDADFIGKQFSFYFPSFQVLERYFLQVCHIWDKLFKSGLNTFFKDCLPQNLLSGKILHTTHIKQYTYSFSLKALFKKLNVWVFFCNPGRMQHESEDAHQF